MKLTTLTLAILLAATGALALHHASAIAPPATPPQPAETPVAWGKPDHNLRLGLRRVAETPLRFELLLQNTGDHDTVLNVGTLLGNGKTQIPDALKLTAIGPAGKAVTFSIAPYFVGGRIDPFVVPLPAGAAYTLAAPWNRYAADPPLPPGIKLPDGPYTFSATFDGQAVTDNPNHDLGGLAFMPYWTGHLESASVQTTLHTPPPSP